jgi:two-component system alkaline phosphatase synthesis response regulator PhoP
VEAQQDIGVPPAAGTAGQPQKKVLVIDDNRTIVDLVRNMISMQGTYQVVVAYNGKQGLEQVEREHPDCVIVDVMMPEMDGFQVVRCLRGDERTRGTPLIILTALDTPEKEWTGYLSGADEYIKKPFKVNELHAAITRVMALTPHQREERLLRLAAGAAPTSPATTVPTSSRLSHHLDEEHSGSE